MAFPNEFKIGQVVQLKSGGPRMTVSDVDYEDDLPVCCLWFDGNGQLQDGDFDHEVLVAYMHQPPFRGDSL
jgi:uncharacterized protein YodC (DUF2158 family)